MHIIDFPFVWIRKLTVPPCEAEDYHEHKLFIVIWPFLGIPIMGMLGMNKWPDGLPWLYYLPIAILWAVYF